MDPRGVSSRLHRGSSKMRAFLGVPVLGQGGLYSPPDCIHYPPGSTPLSLGSVKKKRHLIGCLFFLVDPRGVEPLSENPLIQLSTWVVGLLKFSYETPSNRLFFGYRFNA